MFRFVLPVLLVLVYLVAGVCSASAKRLALVIGNNNYEQSSDLKKAVNDGLAIAHTLKDLGFETTKLINVKRRALSRAIYKFTSKIKPGDEVVFYYSGHGISIGGENYILPVDVPAAGLGGEQFIASESISLSRVISSITQRKSGVAVFIIDACRDNPFKNPNGSAIGNKQGLTRIEPPPGTFVMYSAGYGQMALDRISLKDKDTNSVYTRKLLPLLKTPGLSLAAIARQVRGEVEVLARKVRHHQYPAYVDQLRQNYYFVPAVVSTKAKAPSSNSQQLSPDQALWNMIKNSKKHSDYAFYLRKFPKGVYSAVAHLKLKELKPVRRKRNSASDGIIIRQESLSSFAGTWQVIYRPIISDHPSCVVKTEKVIITQSGSVIGKLNGRLRHTGWVRASRSCLVGTCQFTVRAKLDGNYGSGKFSTGMNCSGKISMRRLY